MTTVVVLTSVALTAVMVSISVQKSVREEITRSLSNDSIIYGELLQYGTDHPTWVKVDDLIRDLSMRYNRRIALKDSNDVLVADTDQLLQDGNPRPLRPAPEAIIDPYEPRIGTLQPQFPNLAQMEESPAPEEDRSVNGSRVAAATSCLDRLASTTRLRTRRRVSKK